MTDSSRQLLLLSDRLAVCQLPRGAGIPEWATRSDFFSITQTPDDLSLVCLESAVPDGVRAEAGWRALRVAGVMDFALIGVLASLATPLARSNISILAISTFDTDYLLVRDTDLNRAIESLIRAGHLVSGPIEPTTTT